MKKEHISEVISAIDENFIEEAAAPVKKKNNIIKYVSIAASFAVILLAATLLFKNGNILPSTPEVPVQENDTTQNEVGKIQEEITEPAIETVTTPATEVEDHTSAEMAIIPQWADLAIPLKYSEVTINNATYSTMNHEIGKDHTDSFLSSTVMQGYDIYEDKSYSVNADIYSIKSINSRCAVAVKSAEDNKYYVYVNVWYEPETLNDLINDLNLRETLSFGKAYSDRTEENSFISRTYDDFDDSIVWNMLLNDTSVKNMSYDRYYDKIAGISVDIPLLGYKNISLGVTKDGYLITNILNTQKCFFIGEEKAEAFGEYLSENVKYTENVTVYENPDGSIPGKEDIGQSMPGYNPDDPQSVPPTIPDYYVPGAVTPPYVPDTAYSSASQFPQDTVVEATTQIE